MPETSTTGDRPAPAGAPAEPKHTRWQRVRRWAIDITIVLLLVAGVSAWQSRDLLDGNGPAPGFELRALDGDLVRLSDFEGEAVQIHFWATWCRACSMEHGALNALGGSSAGWRLLTVVVDSGSAEDVRRYAEEHELSYEILLDDGSVARAFRVASFPTNYYLDRDHNVASSRVGMSTRWGMRWRLARAAWR